MCGIAAYWGSEDFAAGHFRRRLSHRGPDAQADWSCELGTGRRLHFVHCRLAILDLSPAGAQPMHDPATGNVICYNGEIYNFAALRAELAGAGHAFRSSGDTEVLLKGYAQWGEEVFARLDGMFALAIWDARRRRIVLARDHVGIKPLYFCETSGGGWLFASEVRAIVSSRLWRGHVDYQSVLDFLRFGAIQEPQTLFTGLHAFPPGHFARIAVGERQPSRVIPVPYWQAEHAARAARAASVEAHAALVRATVNEQLVADVPVGVFLSAGIDSNVMLGCIDPAARDRVGAFTVSGRVAENNEGLLAAEAAKNLGIRHSLVRLQPDEVVRWVGDGLDAMDQPTADGINTYLVSRASKTTQSIVVLSGTGADELHGGYAHFAGLRSIDRFIRRSGALGWLFGHAGAALYRLSDPILSERFQLLLRQTDSTWRMVQEKRRFFTPSQIAEFWPAGLGVPERWTPPFVDADAYGRLDFLTQVAVAEIRGYLLNTLLRDCDWATMANSQELRVPYLGRRYMELALGLPWDLKLGDKRVNKPLLAALVAPENRAVVNRPKTGFNLNYVDLLTQDLRTEAMEAFSTLNGLLGFEIPSGQLLARLAMTRSAKDSRRVWALLALGRYLARHT